MKCSCPKCSTPLSEDLPDIPEKGKNGKCSACNGSYWMQRESFILRCYAVAGERYCCHCGETLGPSTYCPGCGTLYPDYCIVASKKPAQRAFERKEFTLDLSWPKFTGKSPAKVYTEELPTAGRRERASGLSHKLLMAGAGIAVIAVIAFVALIVIRDRAERKFAREFIVALYGVKSGTDQCLKKTELLASGNRLIDKDIAQLKSVHTEIAAAMQPLSPPPETFSAAYTRLNKLSDTYEKLYSLCITSGPTADVADSAEELETLFNAQAKELKSALSPPLQAELTAKASRYTNLQFMLQ